MLTRSAARDIRYCPKTLRRAADVYLATAAHMLGVDAEAVTKDQRNLAKAIVLGMNYGLSAYGLPLYAFTTSD